jgi:molybdopterin converting factor small subunit
MEDQGLTLDDIHDVIAFRIVTEGDRDSVYAALGVVHAIWTPVQGRFKDYVALPKPNGYQSLHTVVIGPYGERMEVQIRTAEMHRTAELGIACHWEYKEGRAADRDEEQRFAWLRQLLESQLDVEDPHEFLDTLKVDLFPEHVYVFTPKGEVQNLPRNSTPIDFAYAIHSEVGDRCAGAKVNGKLVPLRHTLKDGDTVEIMTSASQFPRKDWLEFVVSGKAKSRIRHSVRAAEKSRSRELGRDILERELRRAGFSLNRLIERSRARRCAAGCWKICSPRSGTEESRLRRSCDDSSPSRKWSDRRGGPAGPSRPRAPGFASAEWETCSCAMRIAAIRCTAMRWSDSSRGAGGFRSISRTAARSSSSTPSVASMSAGTKTSPIRAASRFASFPPTPPDFSRA